ncbi:hypothetical protein BN2475_430013 [Paraburkholderia ribeironis]|uniref:Uncharacterized protein n=1 Tax=Paraburkholderia ribeironis TaxID=1247936 RepID=A0A1N7S953_9BURK|nr:hypothetical protein BN2475_430013 [Paraburkholderia ribeironis]
MLQRAKVPNEWRQTWDGSNAQTRAALASIEQAVAHDAQAYRNDAGELRIPMRCVLAYALKA